MSNYFHFHTPFPSNGKGNKYISIDRELSLVCVSKEFEPDETEAIKRFQREISITIRASELGISPMVLHTFESCDVQSKLKYYGYIQAYGGSTLEDLVLVGNLNDWDSLVYIGAEIGRLCRLARRNGLLYVDLHAGNVLVQGLNVSLIDWEYCLDCDPYGELDAYQIKRSENMIGVECGEHKAFPVKVKNALDCGFYGGIILKEPYVKTTLI